MTASEDTPSSIKFDLRNKWSGSAPPRKWICNGWLPHRLTLFTGHGGAGKSRIALQLAAAVASKKSRYWLPPPADSHTTMTIEEQGEPVLMASWEDEADEVHRRLEKMAETLPWAAPTQIEKRFYFADLAGSGPLWTPQRNNDDGLTEVGKDLRTAAEKIKARLLVVDPRAAAYAGDENHRAQVRAFISHWDRWARVQNCAVLLVDHLPKSSMLTKVAASGVAYAGSTDWHNAARCVWTLDEKQVLRCEKSNYGGTPHPVKLTSADGCAWTGATIPNFGEGEAPRESVPNPFGAD